MKLNSYKRKTINPMTRETEYTNCACCNREITEVAHIDNLPYGVSCAFKLITGQKPANIDEARNTLYTIGKNRFNGDIDLYKKLRLNSEGA